MLKKVKRAYYIDSRHIKDVLGKAGSTMAIIAFEYFAAFQEIDNAVGMIPVDPYHHV